jgi:CMP-2-keto-3-deoxyoctulosonic acid synthetase|tara:strand:+ start:108 stop:278 length:171 start_codon:yes stop_codon:yes gene_type:complete
MTVRDKILDSVAKLKKGKTFVIGCYDKRDRRIEKRISWWLTKLEEYEYLEELREKL